MTKYLYFFMMLACMSFVSCGDSNDDGNGGNDTSKVVVTGSVGDYSFYCGEDSYSFSYLISGYVNLSSEMKLLLGNSLKIGIEVSKNGSYVGTYYAKEIGPDNSFWVLADNLKENTKYQYVAFVNDGGLSEYGDKKTFTTPSAQSEIEKMTATTGTLVKTNKNEAFIKGGEPRLAFSTNRSNLNGNSILAAQKASKKTYTLDDLQSKYGAPDNFDFVKTVVSSSSGVSVYSRANNTNLYSNEGFVLFGLTSTTTYYYCGYKVAMGSVIMGEIKSFTTK